MQAGMESPCAKITGGSPNGERIKKPRHKDGVDREVSRPTESVGFAGVAVVVRPLRFRLADHLVVTIVNLPDDTRIDLIPLLL